MLQPRIATLLAVFARFPVPGQVKTRLAAAIGPQSASELYRAFLGDLVQRLEHSCDRRLLACTPDSPEALTYFQQLAAGRFELWPQPSGSLGARLTSCFETHLPSAQHVIVIGSDAPNIPTERIEETAHMLSEVDCVIGPAVDGGYYLIALRTTCPELFTGINWGGPDVLEQTVQRAQSAGVSLHVLSPWYDVDTLDDLNRLRGHLAAQRAAGIDPRIPLTERLLNNRWCAAGDE